MGARQAVLDTLRRRTRQSMDTFFAVEDQAQFWDAMATSHSIVYGDVVIPLLREETQADTVSRLDLIVDGDFMLTIKSVLESILKGNAEAKWTRDIFEKSETITKVSFREIRHDK